MPGIHAERPKPFLTHEDWGNSGDGGSKWDGQSSQKAMKKRSNQPLHSSQTRQFGSNMGISRQNAGPKSID
jgi:hypothetical protein